MVDCADWWAQYCPVDSGVIRLWMTPKACAKRGAVLFSLNKKIETNFQTHRYMWSESDVNV